MHLNEVRVELQIDDVFCRVRTHVGVTSIAPWAMSNQPLS